MTLRRWVLMGVSGSGKSVVGERLAPRLKAVYRDGDDLHPQANIDKMKSGEPLTDDDRWPWLGAVGDLLRKGDIIVGCSALNRSYRDLIRERAGPEEVCFIHLKGSRTVIQDRMSDRKGHFMPDSLIESQFAALEPPGLDETSVTVDIDQPIEDEVDAIVRTLAERLISG